MAVKTNKKKSAGRNQRQKGRPTKKSARKVAPAAQVNPFNLWMEYLIYAMVVFIPLTFSRITFDQFDIAKMTLFRVLTLLILILWSAKLLTIKKISISWSKWDLLLLGFLGLALVSTFTSIHVFSSLQGKYKRYEGLYTFINYAVIYFLARQIFTNKQQLARLSRIISYTAMAVAAYGLIQYIGLDPSNWGATPFNARSSFSTFGNPDLLGAYLALALPITLANFISSKEQIKTALFGLGYFLVAASLLTTYTRGAWLGGLVGVGALLAMLGFKRLKTNLPKLLIVHLIFLLFFVAVLIISSTNAQPGVMNLSSRIKSATNLSSGTVGSRIEIWKAGLAMIEERPLLGQGLGTYRLASEHFETLKYVQMVRGKVVADNAHNYLVQITAGAGIPAALLFFTFILGIFYFAVRSVNINMEEKLELKPEVAAGRQIIFAGAIGIIGFLIYLSFGVIRNLPTLIFSLGVWGFLCLALAFDEQVENKPGVSTSDYSFAGLTAGAVGYFIYLLAGISVVGSSAVLWVILAVLIGQTKIRKTWESDTIAAFPLKSGLAAVMLFAMLLGTVSMAKMYMADYSFVRFYRLISSGSYDQAVASVDQAFSLYPNGRYQTDLGRSYLRGGSSLGLADRAIAAFKKAKAAEPLEIDYRVFLANSYTVKSSLTGNDPKYVNKAINELKEAVKQRPYSVSANFLLGNFYSWQKKYGLALKYFHLVESLDPNFPKLFSNIAHAYKLSGNDRMAEYYAQKAAATTNSP